MTETLAETVVWEKDIPRNTGFVFDLKQGQAARIRSQTIIDFVCFNRDNLRERFDQARTKANQRKVFISTGDAVTLFNRESPRFIASLISDDTVEHARFYAAIEAPFVGDGTTRWVDGQAALRKPELGLTNWQTGRLFGRGGILTGDTVHTVRTRYLTRKP